ncbi:hypothetical protein BC938DRAFT_479903 [Jimgerdemannia flammicorona]|uniref:Transcription elongation factor 1 homolog n=1 Tax=Jimgerdemannia flammicorona TaxID=994334 RepID=A0A433QJV0_9FUNG|nr:hypothetical protein BC938DRAFT_479903 [Jimgerdemannia flammicorona]
MCPWRFFGLGVATGARFCRVDRLKANGTLSLSPSPSSTSSGITRIKLATYSARSAMLVSSVRSPVSVPPSERKYLNSCRRFDTHSLFPHFIVELLHLSEATDVYHEWIDACDAVNKVKPSTRGGGGAGGSRQRPVDGEEEDDYEERDRGGGRRRYADGSEEEED